MVQKAIRLKTVDCEVFNPDVHVMLIDGEMNGLTMTIETAKEYGLELDIDETKLYVVENGNVTVIEN